MGFGNRLLSTHKMFHFFLTFIYEMAAFEFIVVKVEILLKMLPDLVKGVYFNNCIFVYLHICVFVYLCNCIFVYLYIFVFLYLEVYLQEHLQLHC